MKAIVLLKITSGKVGEVCNILKQLNIVLESCMPFGRYDAAAVIQAESLEETWQIITSQIKPIAGVIEIFPCLLGDDRSLRNLPEHVQEFVAIGG